MPKRKKKEKKRPCVSCVSFFPTLLNLKKSRRIKTAKGLLKALVREEHGEGPEAFEELKQDHEEVGTWENFLEAIDMVIKGQAVILLDKTYPEDGSLETLEEMAKLIADNNPKLDSATYDTSEGDDYEGCFYLIGFKK